MGYHGGSLADLGSVAVAPLLRAAERTAERSGALLHERVRAHTPVAKPPPGAAAEWLAARKRLPGTLRDSWKVGRVTVDMGAYRFSIDVYTDDPVAPHVEYPTMPHVIYPRGWASDVRTRRSIQGPLRFWNAAGQMIFAYVVHHPGTHGSYMLARALLDVDLAWQEIGREELDRWAREVEGLI